VISTCPRRASKSAGWYRPATRSVSFFADGVRIENVSPTARFGSSAQF
jgi:hypothetical protein